MLTGSIHDEKNTGSFQDDHIEGKRDETVATNHVPLGDQELHVSTRKLLWKLDTRYVLLGHNLRFKSSYRVSRILPLFILLVLCSFLDRTNVGNAKLYHLEADLGMTNDQYNKALTAFYPLYIAG